MKKLLSLLMVLLLISVNVLSAFAYNTDGSSALSPQVDSDQNGIPDEDEAFWEANGWETILGAIFVLFCLGEDDFNVEDAWQEAKNDIAIAYNDDPATYKEVVINKYEQIANQNELDADKANQILQEYRDRHGFTQENLSALDNNTYQASSSQNVDFGNYLPPLVGSVGGSVDWEFILDNCVVGTNTITPSGSLSEMVYYSDWDLRYPDFIGPYPYSTVNCTTDANFTFYLNKEKNGFFNYRYEFFYNSQHTGVYKKTYNTIPCTASDVYKVYICAPVCLEYVLGGNELRGMYQPVYIYNETKQAVHSQVLLSSYSRNEQTLQYSEQNGVFTMGGAVGYFYPYYEGACFYECFKNIDAGDFIVYGDELVKNSDGTYTNITQNITYNPALDYSKIYDAIRDGVEDAKLNFPDTRNLEKLLKQYLDYQLNNQVQPQDLPEGITKEDLDNAVKDAVKQVTVEDPAPAPAPENEYGGLLGTIIQWLKNIRDAIVSAKNYVVDIFHRLGDIGDDVGDIANAVQDETVPDKEKLKLSQAVVTRFPFCIPFDIYDAFTMISAPAASPVWSIPIEYNALEISESITIDLTASPWDSVFHACRWFVLLAFIGCLIVVTPYLIRH